MSIVLALLACSEQGYKPIPTTNDLEDTDVADTDVPDPPTPPTPVSTTAPDIDVTPLTVDFGPQPVGVTALGHFTVSNVGDAPLSVSDIDLVGADFAVAGNFTFVLQPGESTIVDVTYLPPGGASLGTATVHSDDPDEAMVDVALLGSSALPDLQVTPMAHDFGAVEASCVVNVPVALTNIGGDVLTVDSITFTDADGSMRLVQPHVLPFELAPGAGVNVGVIFEPTAPTSAAGTLTVGSNDPDGAVIATQVGTSFVNAVSDVWPVPPNAPLDILFVVDQSGSMDARNADMADALDDFVLGLGAVTSDWRIGVVTFDDGCLNTWFDANTPNYGDDFHDAVLLGTQSDPDNQDTERLFALAGRALVNTAPGGCNTAWRRPDGFLHVIMISDENEQSHDPNDPQVPYDTVPGAVAVYESYVQSPGMLTVSAVANLQNTCQSQSDALAQGADRYIAIAAETGGAALDICDDTWGPQMAQLGAAPPTEYRVPLSSVPADGSITVSVDGTPLPTGWRYEPTTSELLLQTSSGLVVPGATVTVAYADEPVCP